MQYLKDMEAQVEQAPDNQILLPIPMRGPWRPLPGAADVQVKAPAGTPVLRIRLRATRERVTPIPMTALVAALGLAPLAIDSGQAGREIQGPMAVVILGGRISSTVMSLIFLPVLILRRRSAQR